MILLKTFLKAFFGTFFIVCTIAIFYIAFTHWLSDPCKGWTPNRQTWATDQYRWSHCPNGHDADS